jgi:arylsulfatase A-like enzyme
MARLSTAVSLALVGLALAKRPNIVFVLTDDQDWHMQSLDHMPLLHKHIISQGTLYANHHCTIALCCPSRVNLWTGKAAHNTNVTDVSPPYGKPSRTPPFRILRMTRLRWVSQSRQPGDQ